jgi:hypothetical protein
MTESVCQEGRAGVYPGSFDPPTIAHLGIAVMARRAAGLDRVDLIVSRSALAKEHTDDSAFVRRIQVIEASVAHLPWAQVKVTEHQLIVDIAEGYDAVILGGDKWAQIADDRWYGSSADRDAALARLPQIVGPNRPGHPPLPPSAIQLELPSRLSDVSSTAARTTNPEWMTPPARKTAESHGIWGL